MHQFKAMGYQPLPSCYPAARKQPQVPYRPYWETPAPASWLDMPARCVQVMTGSHWGLAVLDLDGPMALEIYRQWGMFRELPRTWESTHTDDRGRHVWFSIPRDRPCPSRFLWDGLDHHSAIEILGDRKLAVAPPSRHIKTGRVYRWLPGRSPAEIDRPAPMPDWLFAKPDVRAKATARPSCPPATIRPRLARIGRRSYYGRDVMAAIPAADKLAIARGYGLRIASEPNPNDWAVCHAIGREDRSPSAGFNARTGYYCEPPDGSTRLSLFHLGAVLGGYPTWEDARDDLGDRYLSR